MGLFGPSKKEKVLQSEIDRLKGMLLPEHRKIETLNNEIQQLEEKIALLQREQLKYQNNIDNLSNTESSLNATINSYKKQISLFEDEVNVLEYGVYKPTFEFANSDLYKEKLKEIRDKQKDCIKKDTAAVGATNWTVNGSTVKGNSMVKDTKKLLLRAFNVECDDIVSKVKISNLDKSVERIYKISEQISKLGKTMSISITSNYKKLKIDEVKLALDFQQKKQEEKEKLKELRAQEREEAKALKEIEEEKKRLTKEQKHYENALKTLLAQIEKNGETEELIEKRNQIEEQLKEIENSIVDVDYRVANRKAGYVYIISNIGAFGENIYKIGMTRRLDPQDRVDELGDASVPFDFDIHALIFSEDAPALENALHKAFEKNKLNKINHRREFFNVSLGEIKEEVRKNFDKTVEWIDFAEAEQYRQSLLIK